MKKYKNLMRISLALGLLLAATAARADSLTLSLDDGAQSGPQTTFTFSGTIDYTSSDAANDSSAAELLNGANVVFTGPNSGLFDVTPFDIYAPLSMSEGDTSGDIELFTVTVPGYSATSSNFYEGSFEILGGPDPDGSDQLVLATGDFNVQVTPEPATWQLLGLALVALSALVGWKKYAGQMAS